MTRPRNDMAALSELLGPTLAKLGVADVSVLVELSERWSELTGSPWAENATPQIIRHGELVVEASSTAAVRLLRYGAESLTKRLSDHFGDGVITAIRVVPPDR